jgi:hypothetical protein
MHRARTSGSRTLLLALSLGICAALPLARAQREPQHKGFPLKSWIADLKSEQKLERRAAANAIAALGPRAGKAVQPLLDALQREGEVELRKLYVDALGKIGLSARDSAPRLSQLLTDPEQREQAREVRKAMANAITQVDRELKHVLPLLDRVLNDEDTEIAVGLLDAIGMRGKDASTHLKAVLRAGDHEKPEVREAVLRAGVRIDPGSKEVEAFVKRMLADKEGSVRTQAIATMRKLADQGKALWPDLVNRLVNHDHGETVKDNRILIVKEMLEIDRESNWVLVLLKQILKSKDWESSLTLIHALRDTHISSDRFLPLLVQAMDNPRPEVRMAALDTTIQRARGSKETRDILKRALLDNESRLRAAAVANAVKLNDRGKGLFPDLLRLVDDFDADIRLDVRGVLLDIDPSAALPLPTLVNDLIPEGTAVIAHLHVKTLFDLVLKKSRILDNVKQRLGDSKILREFHLDPVTDVSSVTLAVPGLQLSGLDQSPGLLILRGQFDKDKPLEEKEAEDFGIKTYAVCLNKKCVVVSNQKDKIREAMDRQSGKKPGKLSADLRKVLSRVDSQSMFWLAASLSDDLRTFLTVMARAPDGLLALTAHGNVVGKDAKIRAVFYADSERAAERWKEFLERQQQMLAAVVADQEWERVISDIRLEVRGNQVRMELLIPLKLF